MDYNRSVHNSPDAQAWAKFFIETTKDMDRAAFRDEGYMIAWFSNAMMAMHDHLYKTEIVKLRNDAANEIERLRLDNSNLRGSLQFIAMANPLDGQTWEEHSREIKDYAIKELEWKEPE